MIRSERVKTAAAAMAALLAAMTLLAVLLAGCGCNTPSSATTDMIQKLSDRQFGEAYDSFASNSEMRQKVTRDQFIAQFEAALPDGSKIEEVSITEETVDGDKATVKWQATVKLPGGEEQKLDDSFELVNENGTWKVNA
jgi:hypothetical protein